MFDHQDGGCNCDSQRVTIQDVCVDYRKPQALVTCSHQVFVYSQLSSITLKCTGDTAEVFLLLFVIIHTVLTTSAFDTACGQNKSICGERNALSKHGRPLGDAHERPALNDAKHNTSAD